MYEIGWYSRGQRKLFNKHSIDYQLPVYSHMQEIRKENKTINQIRQLFKGRVSQKVLLLFGCQWNLSDNGLLFCFRSLFLEKFCSSVPLICSVKISLESKINNIPKAKNMRSMMENNYKNHA